MKHFWRIVLVVSILFCSIVFVEWNIYISAYKKNMSESDMILKDAYEFINNENCTNINEQGMNSENAVIADVTDTFDIKKMINNNGIIGILVIPCLNIQAPVKDGTSQEIMRTAIGHFTESDYWNGNVSLASHNSGTSAHYFEKIAKLNENDEIDYITKSGTKKYRVKEIRTIQSTDWSMVLKSNLRQTKTIPESDVNDIEAKTKTNNGNTKAELNNKNTITLITCITGKPKCRLCVRGVEEI